MRKKVNAQFLFEQNILLPDSNTDAESSDWKFKNSDWKFKNKNIFKFVMDEIEEDLIKNKYYFI